MSQFNVQQRRPLIPREQTYVLDRKLVSFHSYDRDVKKWPNSNHFAVELPEDLRNIQSMRLLNIQLPSNQYIFSNEYQNTKLKVTIPAGDVEITIDEGYQYYIRSVNWSGNQKYSSGLLDTVLGIKKGDKYNKATLDTKLFMNPNGNDISSLYMDDGYLFFQVNPIEKRIDFDSVDLEIKI